MGEELGFLPEAKLSCSGSHVSVNLALGKGSHSLGLSVLTHGVLSTQEWHLAGLPMGSQ